MKGTRALPLLVACAVAAGAGLYYVRHSSLPPSSGLPEDAAGGPAAKAVDPIVFIETETGLNCGSLPALRPVTTDELTTRITARLQDRFGPDGLTRRSRAFGLLGLLPPGQDLENLLLSMQAAGIRAWFDDRTGEVLTLADLDLSRPDDRSAFVRLRTRQALHRHGPPPTGHPGDDAWLAREAVHAGIASAIEARFLAVTGGRSDLPTSEETEREATLLALPLYLHNLAQIGTMQGRDFVESRRGEGPAPWGELLADPPAHTLALFSPATPANPPSLPPTPPADFEESLGAYANYLLLERLSDYLEAESVAPAWRGDRYRLFSTPTGTHLIWACSWSTPEAAIRAARIVQTTLSPEPDDPSYGTEQRHTRMVATGTTTRFFNCADPETLRALLQSAKLDSR